MRRATPTMSLLDVLPAPRHSGSLAQQVSLPQDEEWPPQPSTRWRMASTAKTSKFFQMRAHLISRVGNKRQLDSREKCRIWPSESSPPVRTTFPFLVLLGFQYPTQTMFHSCIVGSLLSWMKQFQPLWPISWFLLLLRNIVAMHPMHGSRVARPMHSQRKAVDAIWQDQIFTVRSLHLTNDVCDNQHHCRIFCWAWGVHRQSPRSRYSTHRCVLKFLATHWSQSKQKLAQVTTLRENTIQSSHTLIINAWKSEYVLRRCRPNLSVKRKQGLEPVEGEYVQTDLSMHQPHPPTRRRGAWVHEVGTTWLAQNIYNYSIRRGSDVDRKYGELR